MPHTVIFHFFAYIGNILLKSEIFDCFIITEPGSVCSIYSNICGSLSSVCSQLVDSCTFLTAVLDCVFLLCHFGSKCWKNE